MRYFFDNCVSSKLAHAIRELERGKHVVEHLQDKHVPGTPDTEWLARLGKERDWVVISGDLRIKTRPAERDVWRSAKLTTFFMAKGFVNQPVWEQVRWMIDRWPDIVDMSAKVAAGAAFMVPKRGPLNQA